MRSLIPKAKCVVVVPGVKKAALGVGGQYGRGYMSCRTRKRAAGARPAAIRIEGGSIGFQIGGSDTDVILLVMNDRGVDRLLSSKFTVGADAAVAAGPVGRQASAQTDATMMAEMLAWSRSRGVYAGISLQGSTLREDAGENKELYGKEMPNREIVKGVTSVPTAPKASSTRWQVRESFGAWGLASRLGELRRSAQADPHARALTARYARLRAVTGRPAARCRTRACPWVRRHARRSGIVS